MLRETALTTFILIFLAELGTSTTFILLLLRYPKFLRYS